MAKTVVVMTAYINDKYMDFKEAIESIYGQSVDNFDIYVQEDGPVSLEIDRYLEEQLSQGKIAFLGKRRVNKGFDYSLNELITKALEENYTYIVRMDADDISTVRRIEKQLDFMNSHTDIDISGTYIQEFGDGIEYSKRVKYPLEHEKMLDFFKKRVPVAHVSVIFRDTFFQKAGLYPSSGHINNGDTIMWKKGFQAQCKFANLDFVGVKVRVSKNFFHRRGGVDKAFSDFKNRVEVINDLGYGIDAYAYALASFIVNLLPGSLKKIAYKYLRE